MGYIIFFIFLAGCISNPRYSENSYEKAIVANPAAARQIRENQREAYYTEHFGSRISSGLYYTVSEHNKESFGIGGPNDAVWLGYQKIQYIHNIIVTVVCKNTEYPALESRLSNKPFRWKISEKFKGDVVTNVNGEGQFSFESEDSKKFETVKVIIKNQVYSVPLQGLIRLEVEPEICD